MQIFISNQLISVISLPLIHPWYFLILKLMLNVGWILLVEPSLRGLIVLNNLVVNSRYNIVIIRGCWIRIWGINRNHLGPLVSMNLNVNLRWLILRFWSRWSYLGHVPLTILLWSFTCCYSRIVKFALTFIDWWLIVLFVIF